MTSTPTRRTPRHHRLASAAGVAAAVLVVAAASACGADAEDRAASVEGRVATSADTERAGSDRSPGTGPAEMCAAELVFRGTTYVLDGSQRLIDGVDGPVIGRATVPVCDDTPGSGTSDGDAPQRVDVQRLPGTPRTETVVADGQVWVAYP